MYTIPLNNNKWRKNIMYSNLVVILTPFKMGDRRYWVGKTLSFTISRIKGSIT